MGHCAGPERRRSAVKEPANDQDREKGENPRAPHRTTASTRNSDEDGGRETEPKGLPVGGRQTHPNDFGHYTTSVFLYAVEYVRERGDDNSEPRHLGVRA